MIYLDSAGARPPNQIPVDFISLRKAASLSAIPSLVRRGTERTGCALPMRLANIVTRIYLRADLDAWDRTGRSPLRCWHARAPRRPVLHAKDLHVLARLFASEGGTR